MHLKLPNGELLQFTCVPCFYKDRRDLCTHYNKVLVYVRREARWPESYALSVLTNLQVRTKDYEGSFYVDGADQRRCPRDSGRCSQCNQPDCCSILDRSLIVRAPRRFNLTLYWTSRQSNINNHPLEVYMDIDDCDAYMHQWYEPGYFGNKEEFRKLHDGSILQNMILQKEVQFVEPEYLTGGQLLEEENKLSKLLKAKRIQGCWGYAEMIAEQSHVRKQLNYYKRTMTTKKPKRKE